MKLYEKLPARAVPLKEVESKILGPSGEPITTIVEEPVTTSAYPAHGKAMREQAAHVKALREQFGEEVPAGELFRQREAAGRAGKAAEGLAAGAKAAPAAEAGRQARKAYSAAGHEQIPGSAEVDNLYSNWKMATDSLRNEERRVAKQGLAGGLKGLIGGTLVDAEVDGDARFPELDWQQWQELERREHPADERNVYAYRFLTLERKTPHS